MKARPSRNGNEPKDFQAAYTALSDAREAIERAMRLMTSDVVHGRNYQHLAAADDAVIADRRRILVLRDAMGANIGQLQSEIVEALRDVGEL